jgi:hypothetical protein
VFRQGVELKLSITELAGDFSGRLLKSRKVQKDLFSIPISSQQKLRATLAEMAAVF